jgi:hypothetical protein
MLFFSVPTFRSRYGDAFTVPTYRTMQPQLVLELRRARRYEHPMGVVMLSLPIADRTRTEPAAGAATSSPVDTALAVYGLLGAFLRNTLRETDILTGVPESLAFATFLPGVDRQGAGRALDRFHAAFLDFTGYDLRAGAAAFPDDGLTIEDVLDRACEHWRQACRRDLPPVVTPTRTVRYSHG